MTQSSPLKLTIASRESRLAMWQAEHVKAALLAEYPQCAVDILGMTTRGDQILDRSLSKIGGKGLFVKELELALEAGQADLAAHSLKDVPMVLPDGFSLSAYLKREDPRDAFVSNTYASLDDLPTGAVVGTSSLRRQALILARYPHLVVRPLRGNLDTRLAKLDNGDYAAIILAASGLKRLGAGARIRGVLEPSISLPAAGQGAIAIEILSHRHDVHHCLTVLDHLQTRQAVELERKVALAFGGSCQIPLGVFAVHQGDSIHLRAMVATPDGSRIARAEVIGLIVDADNLAKEVVAMLESQGARAILAMCTNDANK